MIKILFRECMICGFLLFYPFFVRFIIVLSSLFFLFGLLFPFFSLFSVWFVIALFLPFFSSIVFNCFLSVFFDS
jgi:hypothetical protein